MAFQNPFKFSESTADALASGRARASKMMEYDQPLVWVTLLLMLFGMVMVYSASIALHDSPKYANYKNAYFLQRQAIFIAISLIAGGDGKGQDFAPLAEPVARYVRAVLLIGRDAPKLRGALAPVGVDLIDCASLAEATQRASLLAHAGDTVLLSPACASLDMFTDYVHRARVFIDAVRELALSKGQDL